MSEDSKSPWKALASLIEGASGKTPISTTEKSEAKIKLDLLSEELELATDNRKLRRNIAKCVGIALGIEILVLFLLVIAQGLQHFPFCTDVFQLEKWTFSVFTSAVLLQTFGLATVIVKNLFPVVPDTRKAWKK